MKKRQKGVEILQWRTYLPEDAGKWILLHYSLFRPLSLSLELPLAHLLKNPKKKKKKSSPPVPLFFLFMQASTNSLPLLRPSFSLSRFSHPLSNYSTASTTAIAWSHPRLCISCMKLHRSWSPTCPRWCQLLRVVRKYPFNAINKSNKKT